MVDKLDFEIAYEMNNEVCDLKVDYASTKTIQELFDDINKHFKTENSEKIRVIFSKY